MDLTALELNLSTPRLRLRPLAVTDADALWPWVSDPELPRLMTWTAHRDPAETRAFLQATEQALLQGDGIAWAIRHEADLCGVIGLHEITWQWRAWRMDCAELGFWVAPPFQRRGLGTEAGHAVLQFAFTKLMLHKLTVGCFEENAASRRVIEKLGFRYCGTRHDHAFKDGRWRNHRDYELLERDWRRRRERSASGSNRGPHEIALRDVEEADLPILFEHQSDPIAATMAAFPSRDRDAFMTHWTTRVLADPNGLKKAIVIDGHLAGNIVSYQQADKRLIGYWIGRHFWGQGIATAALREFLEHDRTRPLYAFVATQNVASIRVLEKCGFITVEYDGDPSVDDGVEELLMRLG